MIISSIFRFFFQIVLNAIIMFKENNYEIKLMDMSDEVKISDRLK